MGELAALGTALLWTTTSTLVGTQTSRVPTAVISAVQLVTATLLLWIIAAQPKELTVVNIVGSIDLDQLSKLGGQFGIPKIDVEPEKK